jgi:hypothetical protein
MIEERERRVGTDPRTVHYFDPIGRNFSGKIFIIPKREAGKMRLYSPENRMNRLVQVYSVDQIQSYQFNHFRFWMRKSIQEFVGKDTGFLSKWIDAVEKWIECVDNCGVSNALNDYDQESDFSELYQIEFEFDVRAVQNFRNVVLEIFENPFSKSCVGSLEANFIAQVENFGRQTLVEKPEEKKSAIAIAMAKEDAETKELMDSIMEEAEHLKEIEKSAQQFRHQEQMGTENLIFHCILSRSASIEHHVKFELKLSKSIRLHKWIEFFISIFWDCDNLLQTCPRISRLKSKASIPKYSMLDS